MAAAPSNAYIFSTLAKFSEGNGAELSSFLSKFERCCLIGNKVDVENNPVKGQLLMLFVEGRASAILEEYEQTQGGNQLPYAQLAQKLRDHFDSADTREKSMAMFESRIQKVNESEEEYMLELLKLYKTANPNHADAVLLLAVKRKFLSGISPILKKNIFVFCNDPLDANVTREHLLSHCRKARNMLLVQNADKDEYTVDRVLMHSNNNGGQNPDESALAAAINNLVVQVKDHVVNTEKKFEDVGYALAAIGGQHQRSNFRFRGGRGGGYHSRRGNRGGRYNNNSRRGNFNQYNGRGRGRGSGSSNSGSSAITCFNCGLANHYAWGCTLPPNSEN